MDNRERRVEFFRKFKNREGGRNSDFVLQTNSHYSYISRKIFQGKEKYYPSNSGAYDSFKEAFTSFSQRERWYLDLCKKVDPAYRAYVLAELLKVLNQMRVSPNDFEGELRASWEYYLLGKDIDKQLIYDEHAPCRQLIKIIPLKIIETKVYDYDESMSEYIIENGFKYLLIKTDKTITYREEHDTWDYIGIAEVSGNTIIIKNRMGQIIRTFPSDKYLLEAEPYDTYPQRWYVLE